MKNIILLLIISLAALSVHGQISPFTGGAGSGYAGIKTASISCALYAGGTADGTATGKTPPAACIMYSGGSGDGHDSNHSICPDMLLTQTQIRTIQAIGAQAKEYHPVATSLRLYPNPASGIVILQMDMASSITTQIILYRSDGLIARSFFFRQIKGTSRFTLDLHGLASGIYFVYTGGRSERLKLVVY